MKNGKGTHRRARKTGRPTKCTAALTKKIATHIRRGNYIETAAALEGLPRQRLFDWLKRGAEEDGSVYQGFRDAVIKAQAQAEDEDVQAIGSAEPWQARAWRLERKFPNRWGKIDRTEVGIDVGDTGGGGEGVDLGRLQFTVRTSREVDREILRRPGGRLSGVDLLELDEAVDGNGTDPTE